MSVICVASLKGGVGKTSLSINLGHALAKRCCRSLLIDLDPSSHATRYIKVGQYNKKSSKANSKDDTSQVALESPLARLFLSLSSNSDELTSDSLLDIAVDAQISLVERLREKYDIMKGGPETRHFYWGKAARSFSNLFPLLLEEFKDSYDHIIIDTAPDLNVVSRTAIAASDIVVVPVDPSMMSINSLEEIVTNCAHIKGPVWSIIRTMVTKNAKRVSEMSIERLRQNHAVKDTPTHSNRLSFMDDFDDDDMETMDGFVSLIRDYEQTTGSVVNGHTNGNISNISRTTTNGSNGNSYPSCVNPIYLLNSIVYRTEHQNRLSFLGRTAFDQNDTLKLSDQYAQVAREVEEILSVVTEQEEDLTDGNTVTHAACSQWA